MAPPPKPRPTPPLSAPPSRPTGPRPGYLNQFYTPRAPRPSPPVTTWVPAQHVYVQSPLYGFPNPWQGPTNPATYQTPGAYQWVAQDGKRPKQAVKRKGQLNPGQQPSTLQPPTNVMPPPQHYAAQNLTPVFTPGLNQGVTQMLTPPVQAAPAGPLGQYFYPGVPTPAALGSTPGALVSNPGGLAANPVPLGVGSMCNYCTGLMGPGKLGARCSQCGGGFHTDCMRVQGNRMVCRQCSERLSQGEKKKKRKTGAEPKPEKGGAVGFATPAAPAQVGAVGGMGPAPFVANGVLGGGSQVVVHPSGGVPELPGTGEGKKHKKASEKGGAEKGVALKQGGTGRQLRLVWTPDQWAPDGAFVTPLKRAELDWARVQESASESDKKREKENADRLADKRFSREAVERFKKLREERYKKRYGEGGLGDVPEAPPQTGEVGELPRSPAAPAPAKRLKPPVRKTPELEKMAADSAVPICRICYENYNAQLWYIACDRCEKWYHGEAFALVLEDAAKLASWRCGKCLKKRTPDGCPYFDPVDALAEPVWIRPKERNERKERKEVKIAYLRDVEGTAQWHMKREREMRQGRPPSAQGGPVEGVFATPQTGEAKPGENQGHTEQGLVVPGGSEPVAEQVLMGAEGAVGGTIPGPAWLDSIMDLDLEGMSFTDMLSVEHPPANTAAPEMATVTKPAGAHVAEPPRGVAGLTLHGSKGADVAPIQGSTVEATSGSGKAGSVPSRLQPFGHVMAAKVERIAAQKRKAEAKAEKKRKAEAEGVEGGQKKGEKTGGLGLDGKGGSKKGGKKGGEKTEIRPGQQEGGEDVPLVLLLGSWGSVEKKKKKKRKKGDAEGAGPSAGSEGERKKKKRRKERNGEEVAPGGSGVAKNPEGVPPASAQDSGNSGAPILIKIAGRGAGQKRGAEGGGEEGKFAKKVSFVASASEKKAKSAGSGGVAKTPSNADPQPGDSEVSTEKKKKRKGVSNDAPAVPPGAKRRRTEGSRKGKSVFVLPAFLAGNEAKNVPLSGGVTAGRSGAREGSEKKPGEKLKGRRKAAARPIVTEAPTGDSVGGEGVPEKGDAVGGSDAQPDERGGTGKEGTQPTYKRLKIKKRPEGGTSEASAQKIEDVAEGSGKQVEGDRGIEGTGGVQALEGVEARTGDAGAAGAKKAGAGSSVLGGDRSSRGEQEGLLAGKSKAVAEERKLSQGAKTSGDNPAKELNEVSERQGKGKEEGVKAAAQPMVKKIRVRIGRGGGALRSGQSEKEEAQTPQREADSLPGEPKLETTDAPTAGGGEEKGERDSAEMGGSLPAEFGRNVGDVAPPPRKTRQQLKDEAAGTLTKPSEGEAKPPVRADAIDTNEGPKGVSKERVKGKGRPGKAEKGKGKQSETAPQGGGGAGKAERGAAPACSVCGLTTGDVATCKGCHVAVHLVCYEYDQRVLAKKGTKGWKCTACRAGIPAGQGGFFTEVLGSCGVSPLIAVFGYPAQVGFAEFEEPQYFGLLLVCASVTIHQRFRLTRIG